MTMRGKPVIEINIIIPLLYWFSNRLENSEKSCGEKRGDVHIKTHKTP